MEIDAPAGELRHQRKVGKTRVRSTTCIVAPSIATASTCVGQRRSISFTVQARSSDTGGRISSRLAFSPPDGPPPALGQTGPAAAPADAGP